MSHKFEFANGATVELPELNYAICKRLKRLGVVDLIDIMQTPAKWESFFHRLTSDAEFIVNFGYVMLNEVVGTDEQQDAFAESLTGNDRGIEPLLSLGDALREVVFDFFPESRRDAIRQFWSMTMTADMLELIGHHYQATDFTASD